MPAWSGIAGTAAQVRRGTGVVLADDDVLLREGLASLLDRSGFDVLGQAGNGTELLAGGQGLGYLLKSRVTDVAEFIETVERITAGASVVDPSLVQELVRARRRRDPLDVLSPREREVLALMAEGASNAGIARRIYVTEGTVEKHVRSILTKLDLPESEAEHRRVLAVLRFLDAR